MYQRLAPLWVRPPFPSHIFPSLTSLLIPPYLLYNLLSKIDELLPLRCYTVDEYPHFCKFLEFCGLRQRSGLHPPTHPPTGGRPRGAVSARKIPKICKNVGIHRPCSIYWAIFHQLFNKYYRFSDGYQLRVYPCLILYFSLHTYYR